VCIRELYNQFERAEFINDRMLYITLRSRFCDIIVLNVHSPIEDRSDDKKDSFTRN
jgi:hypothetical protein